MHDMQPIYAPDLPTRLPGQPIELVQIRDIPLHIAEDMQVLAQRRNERPDDAAARAILHLQFLINQEISGKRILHRIDGKDLLDGEDIVRELDFGFTGPEHQGLRGKAHRFLQRHRII